MQPRLYGCLCAAGPDAFQSRLYPVVFRSIATVGDTACRMFADAGVISLFHRGRRLDNVAITITGGDTGLADVQEDTAAASRRRIFLAAHPSRN